jgi:hypothetical protein
VLVGEPVAVVIDAAADLGRRSAADASTAETSVTRRAWISVVA